jgi:tetratricopeptide (TPR) repeat protein
MHISAATSPGCSSGALVDDQGRLVGLLSLQSVERQNFTFALPVEWISELSNRTQPVPIGADKGELDGLNRAMVLEEKADWQALLKLSQQQVKRDPANAAAWYSVGAASAHLKQYSQAVQAYREAIRNQAEYDEAWHKLDVAYANLKEYDHAIYAYRDALHIRKENAETWYAWAIHTMNLSSMPTPFMPIGRHCTYSRRIPVPGITWA